MDKKTNICLLGPSGVGKTTLAHKLCKNFNFELFNFTETFQELANAGYHTEIISEILPAQKELPINVVADGLEFKFAQFKDNNGIILDNPYSIDQYNLFCQYLEFHYHFRLELNRQLLAQRVSKRGGIKALPEQIAERARIWEARALPMLELLNSKITPIDASQSEQAVFDQVCNIMQI